MSQRPGRHYAKPPKPGPYAGPVTCLRCEKTFQSWDRRQNRICPNCREAIAEEASEEPSYDLSPLRFRYRDEG
jgi:predicted amidophosphoribosyltransferase